MEQLHTRVPVTMKEALRAIADEKETSMREVVERYLAMCIDMETEATEQVSEAVRPGPEVLNPINGIIIPDYHAILHPSIVLGAGDIQFEYDYSRPACKIRVSVSGVDGKGVEKSFKAGVREDGEPFVISDDEGEDEAGEFDGNEMMGVGVFDGFSDD